MERIVRKELQAQLMEAAIHHMEAIVNHLSDELTTLDEYEKLLQTTIHQMEQQILSGVMNAYSDVPSHIEAPHCDCGARMSNQGMRTKKITTLPVTILLTRAYWYCPTCHTGVFPMDEQLGIMQTQTSASVQREIGFLAAHMTYEQAAQACTRFTQVPMSARQAEAVSIPLGQALVATEDAEVQAVWDISQYEASEPVLPLSPKRLYVGLDGVMARVRRNEAVLTKEEEERKGDVYREVKVATVWEGEAGRERSHLANGKRHDTAGPTWYGARQTPAEQFGPMAYTLAVKHGLEQAQEAVVLGDGAAWIGNLATEQFPQAVQIVDLWHAREHVWQVARAVFGAGTPAAKAWAEEVQTHLEQGDIAEVVRACEAYADLTPEPGSSRSIPAREADYFRTHAHRMRYPTFREQGMLIGSGPVEAGCKTVVSTRFKRSGMRWSLVGLAAMAALRTAVLNGSMMSGGLPNILAWSLLPHFCQLLIHTPFYALILRIFMPSKRSSGIIIRIRSSRV